MSSWRYRHPSGQDLIEYALTLPIMILFIMAIFDFGRVVLYYGTINNASREGAREGVVGPHQCDSTYVRTTVKDRAIGLSLADQNIGVNWNNVNLSTCTPSTTILGNAKVQVGIHYCFQPVTPFVARIMNKPGGGDICLPNTIPLVITSTMMMEQ